MHWLLFLAAADPSPLAQVDDATDWTVIALTILFFVVFLNLMRSLVFGPVLALLEERQTKIMSGLNQVEAQRAEVERLKQDYDRQWAQVEAAAAAKTQAAIDAGKREVMALQEQARAEYLALVEAGHQQLEAEFSNAKEQLLEQVLTLTFTTVERTLAEPVDRAAYEAGVRQQLEEAIHA